MPKWSAWVENFENPYLAWREATIPAAEEAEKAVFAEFLQYGLASFDAHNRELWSYQANLDADGDQLEIAYNRAIEALRARVPDSVLNSDPDARITKLPPWKDIPTLASKDEVIVGVIDIGIPLGHSRLRDKDGKSRILAAWQQLASPASSYLPFGRELLKSEIDDLIAECSGGSHQNWLDEETFNRATGVVDMSNTFGVREAAKVAAHGAHVMDLAAGCDPKDEGNFAEKVKIIAVNMPNVDVVGNSGEFTNGFVLAGIERILTLADAIWQKSFNSAGEFPAGPCPRPIIINISLGKQAGAKNSSDLFPAYLQSLRETRTAQVLGPVHDAVFLAMEQSESEKGKQKAAIDAIVDAAGNYAAMTATSEDEIRYARKTAKSDAEKSIRAERAKGKTDLSHLIQTALSATEYLIWPASTLNIVMPVGNDNLARCNALFEPDHGETASLNWRILPDDQSSNFVEVWISPDEDSPDLLKDARDNLQVMITPPDGPHSAHTVLPQNGVTWLGTQAAVFRETHEFEAENQLVKVLRYVLCVAPTERAILDQETAQAGIWKIEIRNNTGGKFECVCSVQTDQGVLPGSATSRRSYFDDPDYTLYNSYNGMGDLRETYPYPNNKEIRQMYNNQPNLDLLPSDFGDPSPVKRHGTMNATAAHRLVARIAGHRKTDGRPAFYSGTGRGKLSKYDRKKKTYMPSIDDGLTIRVRSSTSTERKSSRAPTASFPTEDGPMHFGILSAGGANGSVVAMRGTSFASPQAARLIAQELINKIYPGQTEKRRLLQRARKVEENDGPSEAGRTARDAYVTKPRPDSLIEVLGKGRIESPVTPKVPRMGK